MITQWGGNMRHKTLLFLILLCFCFIGYAQQKEIYTLKPSYPAGSEFTCRLVIADKKDLNAKSKISMSSLSTSIIDYKVLASSKDSCRYQLFIKKLDEQMENMQMPFDSTMFSQVPFTLNIDKKTFKFSLSDYSPLLAHVCHVCK
jgi:hypothetical protein